jgi:hypothetical protein
MFAAIPPIGPPNAVPKVGATDPTKFLSSAFIFFVFPLLQNKLPKGSGLFTLILLRCLFFRHYFFFLYTVLFTFLLGGLPTLLPYVPLPLGIISPYIV